MDIRVLKYFVVAAQCRSISAASKTLYITQPTLTRQIKDLEDELGQQLLVRSKHGIALTEKGELFYERALEILSMVDKLKHEIKKTEEIEGTISIAAAETPFMTLIAETIENLAEKYDKLRFEIITATRTDALNMLDKFCYDFALVVRPVDTRLYNTLPLGLTRWGVVTRKEGPLGKLTGVKPEQLKGQPLIAPFSEREDSIVESWLGFSLKELNIKLTYNLINNGLYLARQGLGSVVTIANIVETLPENLIFVPFVPKLAAPTSLVWKKGRSLSQPAKLLVTELDAILGRVQE